MAASTSTSNAICNSYRHYVFINHHGKDVKMTFATSLHRRLLQHGIIAFLDYKELQVGRNFKTEIKEAIRTASVHVAIFSERYAESEWCLKELVLMLKTLKTGALIIPVFHNVHPNVLRCTRRDGIYAQALDKLKSKKGRDSQPLYDLSKIEKWRNALESVAEITGLELEKFNKDEGLLVDEVVKHVLKNVEKTRLYVAKYPTGVDEKVTDFKERVLSQKHNGRVGITGLGGVGKTTLALELFNVESSRYTRSHFLSEVRENAKNSLLPSLQSQLLQRLFQLKNVQIDNYLQGKELLRKHLSNYKGSVFIVLDDVDHMDQVDALLPVDVLNGLVLITSRHKDVLKMSKVQESSIYKLTGLNPERARELFCLHAFCHRAPLPGFEALVDKFVRACDRLPLSLKVLGSILSVKRDEYEWKQELESLEQILPGDIQKQLQISYDSLQTPEKQMFLDVACFFIGKYKDTVIRIWGQLGRLWFQTLLDKCLVEEEVHCGNTIIKMHDQLRDLGRDLAKDSKPRHLIWHGKRKNIDDLSDVGDDVRGIKMLSSKSEDGDDVKKLPSHEMKKLQLLEIDFDPEIVFERVPNLKWVRWHNWSFHIGIPTKNLLVLDVQAKGEDLWEEESPPLQLRELHVSAPLSRIPKSIGQLKYLEWMELDLRWWKLNVDFPEEFGQLLSLKHLRLCIRRMELLPESLGHLTNLEYLDLSNCNSLKRLPYTFGNLIKLKYLELSYCSALTLSRESFGNISTLEYIGLEGCQNIEILPSQIAHQRSLAELRVDLRRLKEWPNATGDLSGLEKLVIRTPSLEALDVGHLKSLEVLDADGCSKLKSIEGLAQLTLLRRLIVCGCSELEGVLDVGHLKSLEVLKARECVKLKSIEGLAQLTLLRKLDVSWCSELEWVLDVGHLKSLEVLRACYCSKLKSIEGVAQLTLLRELEVSWCEELKGVLDVGHLKSLEVLNAYRCSKLKSIEGLAQLTLLRNLDVTHCSELEGVLDVGHLKSLEVLKAWTCWKLKSIEGLAQLTLLRELHVSFWSEGVLDVGHLKELHVYLWSEGVLDLGHLKSLEVLKAYSCCKLKSIEGLTQLTLLRELHVRNCEELEGVLDVGHLKSLEVLDASSCSKLKSIGGLAQLTLLRELDVSWCSELEGVLDVGHLKSLEVLKARGCMKLKNIEGLAQLTLLRELDVSYCELEGVLDVGHLKSLEELQPQDFLKLKSLEGLAQDCLKLNL